MAKTVSKRKFNFLTEEKIEELKHIKLKKKSESTAELGCDSICGLA